MKHLKSTKGFTLIELMLVIGIITLLASVAMFSSTEAKKKAQDAKKIIEVNQVDKAINLFKDSNPDEFVPHSTNVETYPLGNLYQEGTPGYIANLQPMVPKYYPKIPESPDGESYFYGVTTDKKNAIFVARLSDGGNHSSPCSLDECDFVEGGGGNQSEYTLTVIPNGVEFLSINYENINIGNLVPMKYAAGTELTLLAYVNQGGATYWQGGCDLNQGSMCVVVMDSDKTLTPVFQYHTLTITENPSDNDVGIFLYKDNSSGPPYFSNPPLTYLSGETVNIYVTAYDYATGLVPTMKLEGCDSTFAHSEGLICTILMNGDKNIIVSDEPITP